MLIFFIRFINVSYSGSVSIKMLITVEYSLFKDDLLTIGAFLSKRVRRFDPSTTGLALDHVLVSRVLPQISAG